MNIKKIFLAAICGGALAVGAIAENHPYGMDIASGIIGYESIKYKVDSAEKSAKVVNIFPLKVNTYCCPWLNNHLGIYGSVGIHTGILFDQKAKSGGTEIKNDDAFLNLGFEFMLGPAFGVDLGDSGIRFQVGAPLHLMGGIYYWENSKSTLKTTITYGFIGMALTPQFRFMANRRCSLVVGADFVFDFALNYTTKNEFEGGSTTSAEHSKDGMRFACTPYIGLGINFGN
jgi:hypothetical protein